MKKIQTESIAGVYINILTIILIMLKLTNHLDLSWFWVLSPIWITISIFIILVTVIFIGLNLK